jgi:uncharacterized membrane protein YccC
LLVATFALAWVLQMVDLGQFVQPLWMIVTGLGFLAWGLSTVPIYAWMGVSVLLCGSLIVAWQSGLEAPVSLASVHLWNASMGAGFVAVSIAVNRRYVWLRPGDGRPAC